MPTLDYRFRRSGETAWTSLAGLVNSRNTSITHNLCTRDYKSATDTASFTLLPVASGMAVYKAFLAAVLDAQKTYGMKVEAEIWEGAAESGTRLFDGYVDLANTEISSSKTAESLSVKLRDRIIDLDRECRWNRFMEGAQMQAVVQALMEKAGVTGRLECPELRQVAHFVVTEDDGNTFREIIDTLLFEAPGLVLTHRASDGAYVIRRVMPVDAPQETVRYLVKDSLKTTSTVWDHDGVKVSWPTVKERAGLSVYIDDISTDVEGYVLKDGYHYPEDGDAARTFQEYSTSILDRDYNAKISRVQNADIDLLYVKGAALHVGPLGDSDTVSYPRLEGVDLGDGNPKYFPRKAQVLIRNDSGHDITLKEFDITGTAVYRSKINTTAFPTSCEAPDEYEASYIEDRETAELMAAWWYDMEKFGSTTATWTDPEGTYSVGDRVLVRHKAADEGTAQPFTIVADCDTGSSGVRMHKYTAIAYGAYDGMERCVTESGAGVFLRKGILRDGMEYCVTGSFSEPPSPSDPGWTTGTRSLSYGSGGQPQTGSESEGDSAVWARRVVTYTTGQKYISEPVLANTPFVISLYRYGVSGDVPPMADIDASWDGNAPLFWAGRLIQVSGGRWTENVPQPSGMAKYLWMAVSIDNGETWRFTRLSGEDGEDGWCYTVLIHSSNGSIFRMPSVSTVLRCQVLRNGQDITAQLEDWRFSWERKSGDSSADERWNTSEKAIGHKEINITGDDCTGRSVFTCSVELEEI